VLPEGVQNASQWGRQTFEIRSVRLSASLVLVSFRQDAATASRTAVRPTQPPIQWVPAALSLRVKRPEREADHLPAQSAEVKNTWSYTTTPPYFFMA